LLQRAVGFAFVFLALYRKERAGKKSFSLTESEKRLLNIASYIRHVYCAIFRDVRKAFPQWS